MIPKIIHYCWLSDDSVPEEFENYIIGWKQKLVDYKFIKWDFKRFPKSLSAWVTEAFDNKKYAFAADYIRLYAVYHYGGIYMDMDIEVLRAFDALLCKPYMMAAERPNKPWIEAGCFGAEKGNEFIGYCLERYKDRRFVKPDGTFDQMPLPQVMEKVREEHNINLELYPWYYFTAKSYDTGDESPGTETYTIHHFAGSWKTKEEMEDLENARKYSKIMGIKVGQNLAEYQGAARREGIKGIVRITAAKIKKKLRKRVY